MGNKKIYIIGGIVLLVIAGVSIGAYFLVKKKNKESDELKSKNNTTNTTPTKNKYTELLKSERPKKKPEEKFAAPKGVKK
jgi:flagellar basal body-associated protein FliL